MNYLKLVVVSLMLFLAYAVQAQEKSTNFFVSAGGAYSSFQDQKYSDVRYNGFGSAFGIGFEKHNEKALWGIHLNGVFTKEKPSTHSATRAKTTSVGLDVKYLRKVKQELAVGATLTVFDFYNKQFENLRNNGRYFIVSSTLWLSGRYQYKKFRFDLDVAALTFVKEKTGFAFSAPQSYLENGEFTYQNENADTPLGFKEYTFRSIPKNLQLRTSIMYQWNDRWLLGYGWEMQKLSEVKNYPVVYGIHTLKVRFNIIK